MQERMTELQTKRKTPSPLTFPLQKPVYMEEPPSPPLSARLHPNNEQVATLSNQLQIHEQKNNSLTNTTAFSPIDLDYASDTQLPQWFKKKRQKHDHEEEKEDVGIEHLNQQSEEMHERKNKWAERLNKFTPFGHEESNKWFQDNADDNDEILYTDEDDNGHSFTANTTGTNAILTQAEEEDVIEQPVVFDPSLYESNDFKVDKEDKQQETLDPSIGTSQNEIVELTKTEAEEVDSIEDEEDLDDTDRDDLEIQVTQMDFLSVNYKNLDKPFTPSFGRPSISSDFFKKSVILSSDGKPLELNEANQEKILPPTMPLFGSISNMITAAKIPIPPPPPDNRSSLLKHLELFKKKKQNEKSLNTDTVGGRSQEFDPVDRHKQLNERLTKYIKYVTLEGDEVEEQDKRIKTSPQLPDIVEQVQIDQLDIAKNEDNVQEIEEIALTRDYEIANPNTPVIIETQNSEKETIEIQEKIPQTIEQIDLDQEDDIIMSSNAEIVSSPNESFKDSNISRTTQIDPEQRHELVVKSKQRVNKLKHKLTKVLEEVEEMIHEGAKEEELNDLRTSVTDLYQSIHNFMLRSSISNSTNTTNPLTMTTTLPTTHHLSLTSSSNHAIITAERLDSLLEHYSDMLMAKISHKMGEGK